MSTGLLRPLEESDNAAVAEVIRTVMPEFGADGEGFALHDPEVDDMFTAYSGGGARFFVLEIDRRVVGCAGVAPLLGGDKATCELRKMYFLPQARGLGFGIKMLQLCLQEAKELGYQRCYLETLDRMHQARALYERSGFVRLDAPKGSTGHHGCNAWYARTL